MHRPPPASKASCWRLRAARACSRCASRNRGCHSHGQVPRRAIPSSRMRSPLLSSRIAPAKSLNGAALARGAHNLTVPCSSPVSATNPIKDLSGCCRFRAFAPVLCSVGGKRNTANFIGSLTAALAHHKPGHHTSPGHLKKQQVPPATVTSRVEAVCFIQTAVSNDPTRRPYGRNGSLPPGGELATRELELQLEGRTSDRPLTAKADAFNDKRVAALRPKSAVQSDLIVA